MRWSEEDKQTLRRLHGRYPIKAICAILNRSLYAVQVKINRMGLKKLPSEVCS